MHSTQVLSTTLEQRLTEFCIAAAEQNLPFDRKLIHTYAQELTRSVQPGARLGRFWVDRILTRNQDKLTRQWSRPLDKVRSASATPEAVRDYFDMYKALVGENGEKIPPHRQFAYDETGVLRGYNQPQRSIVAHNAVQANRNSSGSRELITFVPLISAAGKFIDGLAIFPGKLLRKEWVRKNPKDFAYVNLLCPLSALILL